MWRNLTQAIVSLGTCVSAGHSTGVHPDPTPRNHQSRAPAARFSGAVLFGTAPELATFGYGCDVQPYGADLQGWGSLETRFGASTELVELKLDLRKLPGISSAFAAKLTEPSPRRPRPRTLAYSRTEFDRILNAARADFQHAAKRMRSNRELLQRWRAGGNGERARHRPAFGTGKATAFVVVLIGLTPLPRRGRRVGAARYGTSCQSRPRLFPAGYRNPTPRNSWEEGALEPR